MKTDFKKLTTLTLALSGLASCATHKVTSIDPVIQNELSKYDTKIDGYKDARAHLLSPGYFEKVKTALDEAREKAEYGEDLNAVNKRLDKSDMYFSKMDESLKVANLHLNDVLDARSEAMEENAKDSKMFKNAEKELTDLGYEIEEKDINEVLEDRAEVEKMYVNAEINAIKNRELTPVRNTFEQANNMDGSSHFDEASDNVKRDLEAAADLIEQFKDSPKRYSMAVTNADESAKRFLALSKTASWVEDKSTKELVLKLDNDLNDLLTPLAFSGAKFRPYKEKMSIAKNEVGSIPVLMDELTSAQITAFEQKRNLRRLEMKNDKISNKLDQRKAMTEKVEKIRSMFSDEEAKIVINGDDLVIKLVGLNFAFDDAKLPKDSKKILKKVAKTAQTLDFPEMKIIGHADSKGDAIYNERLSEKRAKSVNSYLVNNSDIKKNVINVEGAGFKRPFTENKTDNGRKMNRRIDVVFNSVVR